MNPKERYEKANAELQALATQIRDGKELTEDQETRFAELDAELQELESQIEQLNKAEERQRFADTPAKKDIPVPTPKHDQDDPENRQDDALSEEKKILLFNAWVRRNADVELTPDQEKVCREVGFSDRQGVTAPVGILKRHAELRRNTEKRADTYFSTGVAATGGNWVPTEFYDSFIEALTYEGPMLNNQCVNILETSNTNPIDIPTADDTDNSGARQTENTAIGDSETPVVDKVTLNAYKHSSKMFKVPMELIQDAGFDITRFVGTALGKQLSRGANSALTTGDGSGDPTGIVTAATLGKTGSYDNAISYDELVDLMFSVDAAYRNRPSAGWMLNGNFIAHLMKLKDGDGRPIWVQSAVEGQPDRLMNRPVWENPNMASAMGDNVKAIIFGDLAQYWVRIAGGIRFVRLDERYADQDQVGFVAHSRIDGNVCDGHATHEAIKYLQMGTATAG